MRFIKPVLFFVLLLVTCAALAQPCPTNISFEDGTFTGWQCYSGIVDANGNIQVSPGPNINSRHTIWKNSSPQVRDPYGDFPVNCPNGSKYSLQLGNTMGGHEAESVSYTYTIPADRPNFTITYYYATVLQTPSHQPFQQPAFRASVEDVSTGTVISSGDPKSYKSDLDCGNHVFTASAGLAGFQTSKIDRGVVYKDWSPVVINLVGYAGHTIKMTFTTNDCVFNAHFGYAYLDFNDICDPLYDGLIVGNKFCSGSTSMLLTAPAGFQDYAWYDAGFVNKLGTDHTLKIDPLPEDGTKYALIVTPFPGLGCIDTLYTTAKKVVEAFSLNVQPLIEKCQADGADITQADITQGSSPGLKYEYYEDADGQVYLSDPKLIRTAGTYYIRGTNSSGCTDLQPIVVKLYEGPELKMKLPAAVCEPATVDMTLIASTDEPGVTFDYYTDLVKKIRVTDPKHINKTGNYYITATSAGVPCASVRQVSIIVSPLPVTASKQLKGCPPVSLESVVDTETAYILSYKYYTDAACTQVVPDPAHITQSGVFYYQATNLYGCKGNVATITATVFPPPVFKVNDPDPVVFPRTINLMDTHAPLTYAEFTYWKDAKATIPLENYQTVGETGTYYIRAINVAECVVINPVHVLINAPPEPNLVVSNTFSPNGDGINDEFRPTTVGAIKINFLKIYNRYGIEIFSTRELLNRWDGTLNGKQEPSGTYYWVFNCYDNYRKKTYVRSGSITIVR